MAQAYREKAPALASQSCATALTEGTVNAWISKVSTVMSDAGLGELSTEEISNRMWNCDEMVFATDVASKKILARRGEKNIHETGGVSGREHITVLGCGSGSGECLPPYVVYKGNNLWTCWTIGGPAGTLYTVSESGWMERPHFLEWSRNSLLYPASWRLDQSFSSWMAMPLTLT